MVSMGHEPTDEDVFLMISQVDDDNSGEIEFSEFLRVIENQHENDAAKNDESDTIQAFIALGGNEDKTGTISTEKLTAVCTEFGLTIDINALIKEFDADGSGEVDYDEEISASRRLQSFPPPVVHGLGNAPEAFLPGVFGLL